MSITKRSMKKVEKIKEELKPLYRRVFDISWRYKLSHLGSCVTALPIIDEIYSIKKLDEKFVLSSGHAGLALYCVLEKYGHPEYGKSAEEIWKHHGTHPDRCKECHLDCSSGSLGMGLPIAVGMALARPDKNVYCLISDGECSEGSIWEALRIASEQKLTNLKVYLNFNGWGAYKKIELYYLTLRLKSFFQVEVRQTNVDDFPFLKGQAGHYRVMDEEDYKQAMEVLS